MKTMPKRTAIFRNMSIKWKLMLATCIASTLALAAIATTLFVFRISSFRTDRERELQTLAQIMADNSSAALAFKDANTGAEILAPLRFKTEILAAQLLAEDGKPFTVYGESLISLPKAHSPAGIVDNNGTWTVIQPVVLDNQRIGTFLMEVDYAGPFGKLRNLYITVAVTVFGFSIILVFLLTLWLQSYIVRPIQLLADASKTVARDRDYSFRVSATSRDECGQLTTAFNEMLARIGEQDKALHFFGEQLQFKVDALENENTERQRAEEALSVSQQKLVETSRLAGMAEVATGVLHNVGNVLNSVNVSTGIVKEKLRRSKAPRLVQAAELLNGRNGGLAEYITQDPNGKKVPGLLLKLGQFLVTENAQLLSEVDQLSRNIEHIKEVVNMQQSYAKVSGAFEDLALDRLADDAIAMNAAAFERHGIKIERRFSPAPPVRVDRHRVLQILINILRNAKHALDEIAGKDKRITISIEPFGEDRARLSITDNGVGIPKENLNRIFGHGFTTRKDGHGFGLHSGALAAKQMNGSLSAHSDGPGHGATFILELKIAAKSTTL